jgi:hypothetical protein
MLLNTIIIITAVAVAFYMLKKGINTGYISGGICDVTWISKSCTRDSRVEGC